MSVYPPELALDRSHSSGHKISQSVKVTKYSVTSKYALPLHFKYSTLYNDTIRLHDSIRYAMTTDLNHTIITTNIVI